MAKRSTSRTKAVSKATTAKRKPHPTKKVAKTTKAKTAKAKTTKTTTVKSRATGKPKVTSTKKKTARPSSATASGSAKKVKSKTSKVAAKKKTKRTTTSASGRPVAAKADSSQSGKTKVSSQAKASSEAKSAVKTKKQTRTSAKKIASPVAVKSPAAPKPRRIPKTHLTRKQLAEFRELLLAKRAELAADVDNLTRQALSGNGRNGGETSSMPIHMADLGSDNWEQEFTLGLIDNEKALVREIDETLNRIQDRTYGVCVATHKPITIERLRAKPWAKYCIDYARLREEGRAI